MAEPQRCALDSGQGAADVQFAGRCWSGGSQIFLSGWDWTERTFGFLVEAELLILVVPPAFLPQPRACVSQHVPG